MLVHLNVADVVFENSYWIISIFRINTIKHMVYTKLLIVMLLICNIAVKTTQFLKESHNFVYSESVCRETKIFVYWTKYLVT